MTETAPRDRGGRRVIGLGALACAGCCAGPILAWLGALSVAGLAGTILLGGVGLLVATAAALTYVVVRRRRRLAGASCGPRPVLIATPTRRPEESEEVPAR